MYNELAVEGCSPSFSAAGCLTEQQHSRDEAFFPPGSIPPRARGTSSSGISTSTSVPDSGLTFGVKPHNFEKWGSKHNMYTEALTRCWWKGRTVWESKVSNRSRAEIYCTSPLPWEQLSPLCNDSRSEQMAIPVLINPSVQHSHSLRERGRSWAYRRGEEDNWKAAS